MRSAAAVTAAVPLGDALAPMRMGSMRGGRRFRSTGRDESASAGETKLAHAHGMAGGWGWAVDGVSG